MQTFGQAVGVRIFRLTRRTGERRINFRIHLHPLFLAGPAVFLPESLLSDAGCGSGSLPAKPDRPCLRTFVRTEMIVQSGAIYLLFSFAGYLSPFVFAQDYGQAKIEEKVPADRLKTVQNGGIDVSLFRKRAFFIIAEAGKGDKKISGGSVCCTTFLFLLSETGDFLSGIVRRNPFLVVPKDKMPVFTAESKGKFFSRVYRKAAFGI